MAGVSRGAARWVLAVAAILALVYVLLSCFFAPKLTDVFHGADRRGSTLAAAYPARCAFVVVYTLLLAAIIACVAAAAVVYKQDGSNTLVVLLAVAAPLLFSALAMLVCYATRKYFGDAPTAGAVPSPKYGTTPKKASRTSSHASPSGKRSLDGSADPLPEVDAV